jgi:hypothetical protein
MLVSQVAIPAPALHNTCMSYTGTIQDGKIVITSGITLPEGTRVQVIVEDDLPPPAVSDWVDEVEKLAKPRGWPADYARNLDQHLAATHRA